MKLVSIPANPVPDNAVTGALLTRDGVTLRFARFPPPAGRKGTVVVLQGRAEYVEKYFETVRDLRARGFAVATFDWRGQGLSDRTGSATGYAFDASKVASADDAARLAAALGVTGTPQVQWGSWVVGPNDGSGPTVTLDGSGNLSFYDPGRDPWQCQASSSSGVAGSAEGVLVPPAGVVASVPAVPMPSAPAAPTMVPVPSPSP